MAFRHGRDTVYTLDGNDLSSFTKSHDWDRVVDSHDVTHYGDDDRVYQSGLRDGTVSIEGTYDDGASSPRDIIQPLLGGAAVTFVRQPEGTGTGLAQDSVSVIVTGYGESDPVDDMITWTCELQLSGPVTSTAQA